MKVRIIGAGFYGCHVGLELHREGHHVEIFESRDSIFKGASGSIPARVHEGFHYPRSKKTRDACQAHSREFKEFYSDFISPVGTNIYAIAENDSMVDFAQYVSTLEREVPFELIKDPSKYGLKNVEGAILTEEEHIVTDKVRDFFLKELDGLITYDYVPEKIDDPEWDVTVDATFCWYSNDSIDRYEPCVVGMLEGPVDKAVTIMDGPFASVYPWNPELGLVSLSSARYSPFSKECNTYQEANTIIRSMTGRRKELRVQEMVDDLSNFFPEINAYKFKKALTSIRAMPRSGADSRLVGVDRVGETGIRIRAGKIDAVIEATQIIREMI